MNLVEVQSDSILDFNSLLEKNNGHFFQSPQWAAFKQSDWSIKHYFIENKNTPIGGASLYQRNIPLLNRPYIYVPGGPVFVSGNNPEAWSGFTQLIRRYAESVGAVFVKVDPPLCGENYGEILAELGYFPQKSASQGFGGYKLSSTIICDISGSEDDVLERIPKKTRYYIRYPSQKGVEYIHLGQEGLGVFMDIIGDTSKRANFDARQTQYYQRLMEAFGNQAQITAAFYDKIPIAAGITIVYGQDSWAFAGGQSSYHKHLRAHYGLNWERIKWAKEMGATNFDLYGIPVQRDKEHSLMGLYTFKKSFGGSVVDFVGEWDLPVNNILYNAWRTMVVLNKIRGKVAQHLPLGSS